jgi:hypothetical protein
MESKSRETQYSSFKIKGVKTVATVHSKTTQRLDGKRQCKGTERLGDFHSGKKTLATSQDRFDIIKDSDLIEGDDIDALEDDDDNVNEIENIINERNNVQLIVLV